jgi:hypothetical protein
MRSLMQTMLVVITGLVLLAPADFFAQSPSPRPGADIILDVIATHSTMASEDRYVYLRAFSDGTAEYQSAKRSDAVQSDLPVMKKTLTQDEFNRIRSILSEPRLAALRPKYATRYAIVDSWTEWTVKIKRSGQTQSIQVLEFSPGLARIMKHPYPDALVRLGCNIEKLRADVSGESDSLHSDCKKALGMTDQPAS